MNSEQLQVLQTALDEHTRNTGHRYRIGLAKAPSDQLGEHYFYIERRVSGLTQPYIRETFGEWMNFFDMGISKGELFPDEIDSLRTRIEPDVILELLYGPSVIHERGIVKTWLEIMAEMDYSIYSVNLYGRDDHIAARVYVSNKRDVYVAHLTINTK
ncbi:hypothetical protein D3C81_199590 [compost metagenome]